MVMEELNFANHPPSYKSAAQTLMLNLSRCNTFSDKKQKFENFSKHYSVTPKIWEKWVTIEHDATCKVSSEDNNYYPECYNCMKKLHTTSIKHFYVEPEIFESHHAIQDRPYQKLISFPDFDRICHFIPIFRLRHVILLEQVLVIPHSKLNEILALYEHYSDAPLSKAFLKQHEDAKKLYVKLISAKTDINWLTLLLESKDDEFIVANIECRLSKNPCNKEIWMFYLNYFEKRDDIRILDIYRRYCRFFIEDAKMRENYAFKVKYFQKQGYDIASWKNDLKNFYEFFTTNDEVLLFPKISDVSSSKTVAERKGIAADDNDKRLFADKIFNKKCKLFFNSEDYFTQNFSLPKTIMLYLTAKNLNIVSYRKLNQTCKYFFTQKQVIPIWHIEVTWHIEDFFHRNSVYMGVLDKDREPIKRKTSISFEKEIWVEHSINIYAEFKFLNKIYQCDIQYLQLYIDVTLSQYDTLVKSERIKEINLYDVRITSLTEEVTYERLLKWLLNANKISMLLKFITVTPTSSETLCHLKRNAKIEELRLNELKVVLEPKAFCKFLKDNLTSKSSFDITYTGPVNENYQKNMNAAVEKMLAPFQEREKPKIKLRY